MLLMFLYTWLELNDWDEWMIGTSEWLGRVNDERQKAECETGQLTSHHFVTANTELVTSHHFITADPEIVTNHHFVTADPEIVISHHFVTAELELLYILLHPLLQIKAESVNLCNFTVGPEQWTLLKETSKLSYNDRVLYKESKQINNRLFVFCFISCSSFVLIKISDFSETFESAENKTFKVWGCTCISHYV